MENKSDTVKTKSHSYLWAIFNQKCPHCRQGDMFKDKSSYRLRTFMEMYDKCIVCGQKMEIEEGFYIGTGYVSYVLTVALSASTFVAWCVLIGISVNDNRVFWWLGINALLLLLVQPYFMRLARLIWLSFFVKYDADFKIAEQKPIA